MGFASSAHATAFACLWADSGYVDGLVPSIRIIHLAPNCWSCPRLPPRPKCSGRGCGQRPRSGRRRNDGIRRDATDEALLDGELPADWRLVSAARSGSGRKQPLRRADGLADSMGACKGQRNGTSQRNRCGELRILCSLSGPTALHIPAFRLAGVPTRFKSKRLKPSRDLREGRPWRSGCPAPPGPGTFRQYLRVAMALSLLANENHKNSNTSTQQFARVSTRGTRLSNHEPHGGRRGGE